MQRDDVMAEFLSYRGDISLEEAMRKISAAIITRRRRTDPPLDSLERILCERKVCFSTPILLHIDSCPNPQTASCYIADIDRMSIPVILELHNNIFDGSGGVGSDLSARDDIEEVIVAVEENARNRYCGLPSRGCSIGAILRVDHPLIHTFIQSKPPFGSLYHTIRNIMLPDGFINRSIISGSPEKYLLEQVVESMIQSGSPGLLFEDNINHGQPYKIRATNPCAEFLCADDTAANLASLNLARFITDGTFNHKDFFESAKTLTVALNIILDTASYPTEQIRFNTLKYRPIGVGITNYDGALRKLGCEYGSEEALSLLCTITKELAFAVSSMGFGNTQTTLIAPTGRIGLLMDCESFEIESRCSDERLEINTAAAAQPHLTGGISLTICCLNPSRSDVIEDILHAHRIGLKSYIMYNK